MHYCILFRAFCTDRQDKRKNGRKMKKKTKGEKEKMGVKEKGKKGRERCIKSQTV